MDTINFWLDGGIERTSATACERSEIVASQGKEKLCGIPWRVRFKVSTSSSAVDIGLRVSVAMFVL